MIGWKTILFFMMTAFLANDQHVFGVGGKAILCVPERDMDSRVLSYAEETTNLEIGRGHAPGFAFLFDPAEMRDRFPNYYVNRDKAHPAHIDMLHGSLGFTSLEDRRRWGPAMRARNVEDIWFSRGACPNPLVQRLPETDYYRVKCAANSRDAMIWGQAPQAQTSPPEDNQLVLGTCLYDSVISGPYEGYEFRDCRRVVIIDGFLVDYQFQEQNAGLIPKFDSFLTEKIAQWKENCLGHKL